MKFKKSAFYLAGFLGLVVLLFGCNSGADQLTCGIGVYPGNPAEDFSPFLKTDKENYRNIAKHRIAYHSSAFDYKFNSSVGNRWNYHQ
ncbi:MAG: hypothetical protein HQ541_12435 [Mariniphaga sp.]|nr:hypothetical protein [Mariniphaga sp.]